MNLQEMFCTQHYVPTCFKFYWCENFNFFWRKMWGWGCGSQNGPIESTAASLVTFVQNMLCSYVCAAGGRSEEKTKGRRKTNHDVLSSLSNHCHRWKAPNCSRYLLLFVVVQYMLSNLLGKSYSHPTQKKRKEWKKKEKRERKKI